MPEKEWVLWENMEMSLEAAHTPAIPRTEGFHLVLLQKWGAASPWKEPELYARMSELAAKAAAVIMDKGLAQWVNIHYDGNIGAAEGKPFLHIHIYARYKTGKEWGGPLTLPFGKGPYGNTPLTEEEIERLRSALVDRV